MKQNITIKMIRLAIAALMILCASTAMAGNNEENSPATIEADDNMFQLVPLELPKIGTDVTVQVNLPSDAGLQEKLAELTTYKEETQMLIRDIKSKWAAYAEELAEQNPETEKIAALTDEISELNKKLATMRLEQLQATNSAKASTGNSQLLATR